MEEKYEKMQSKVTEISKQLNQVSLKVDQVHTYLSKAQNAMTEHQKRLREKSLSASEQGRTSRLSSGSFSIQRSSPVQRSSSSLSDELPRAKVGANAVAGSTRSSGSHTHSKLGSKHSLEVESVDGRNPVSPNDDVFVAKSIVKKPPVLPKPKKLLGKKLSGPKEADRVDDQKPISVNSPKLVNDASAVKEKLSSIPRASISSIKRELARLSSSDSLDLKDFLSPNSGSTALDQTVNPPHQSKKKPVNDVKEKSASIPRESISSVKREIARLSSSDSLDLKDYLLECTPNSGSTALKKNSSGSQVVDDGAEVDALVDDLADWCLQVEDELTQLYNESLLSVS